MLFKDFAEKLALMETTESRLKIRDFIFDLFSALKPEERKYATYLILSRINPPYLNKELNIGHSIIIQAISKSFGIDVTEIEKKHQSLGDLGLVAEFFSEKRKQKSLFSKQVELLEVYNKLKSFSETIGKSSVDSKINNIAYLYNNTSPQETKYLTKLIVKTLRLNFGSQTLIDALALKAMLEKGYKTYDENMSLYKELKEKIEFKQAICNDIGEVVAKIWNKGIKAIDKIKVNVGIPIMSSLGERENSPEAIIKRLGHCIVEGKYDGFRTQVHKDKKINMFSRRSEEITNYFPELVDCFKKTKSEFILDAEAIGYNAKTKKYLNFQETIKRKRKYLIKETAERIPVKLVAFDVLYYNGKEVLTQPLKERRKLLEKIIKEINNENVISTEAIYTDDPKELKKFFDKCLDQGLEGIFAKNLEKPYMAGQRDFAWIKLKKNYTEGKLDSFDLCVMGYFYGKGKNKTMPSSLLCGTYDSETNTYYAIAKVGSGLTEENMGFFKKEFENISVFKKPFSYNTDLEPDVYVLPKLVIEVLADEITNSPLYKGKKGYSLRFPRFISLREDKLPEDTTTIEEIEDIYYLQTKKSK